MRKHLNTKIAVVALGAVAVTGTGVAYAYWTTTGSGTGSATTTAGVDKKLTFTQDALAPMFPGDASQPLSVTVKNSSTESAYVATVKAYVATDKTGCTGADFLLDGTAAPVDADNARALTWAAADLAAGGEQKATSTIQFNNTKVGQDACKGAKVTVHYLAS